MDDAANTRSPVSCEVHPIPKTQQIASPVANNLIEDLF